LNAIIRSEIEKFDGPAIFIDAFKMTSNKRHEAVKMTRIPGTKRRITVFGKDGIHLTRKAVQNLLANPSLKFIRECAGQLPPPAPAAKTTAPSS
jgi:hypothetical protein